VLCLVSWARAGYDDYHFSADRFEVDGNVLGLHDGNSDLLDDFGGDFLLPNWYKPFGTAYKSDGLLHLTSPGTHYPGPNETELVISDVVSVFADQNQVPRWFEDGSGDFTATSYWEPIIPEPGEMYHLTLYTFVGPTSSNELFGVDIRNEESQLLMEQHLIHLNQTTQSYELVETWILPISEDDVTGQVVFRIGFDDANNTMHSSYSLDGGQTFASPFPSAPIFQDGRTQAQFIIGAHPEIIEPEPPVSSTPIDGTGLNMYDKVYRDRISRNVYFFSKGPQINIPDEGGVGDPLIHGGSVEILNTSGSGESVVIQLPAENWWRIPQSTSGGLRGWKYKERVSNSATDKFKIFVLFKQSAVGTQPRLKIKLKDRGGNLIGYSLDESSQGSVGVRFHTGDEQHCADFGGTIRRDQTRVLGDNGYAGWFRAKEAAAPETCE
jgi:hypothetical protein